MHKNNCFKKKPFTIFCYKLIFSNSDLKPLEIFYIKIFDRFKGKFTNYNTTLNTNVDIKNNLPIPCNKTIK